MPNYEMGEMPEAPESDEMDMEGMDYEMPEEEMGSSDIEGIKSKIAEMSEGDLKEVEAAVADALSKMEESEEDMPESEEAPEGESDEASAGDLSAMFS